MAIIRIKRTTGFSTPQGLTFGELAFVQGNGSGGKTANRLYIANNAGVCVWIGAEILDQPTFWSGTTAESTLPTVSAVEGRIDSKLASSAGVTGLAATADTWTKLSTSFTNAYRAEGATGFINILGATWGTSSVTNAGSVGGIANGTNLEGKTVFEILQNLLYSYQTVSLSQVSMSGTFSTGNLELGQTAASGGSRNFGWTANNPSNINSEGMSVTYSGYSSGTIIGGTAYSNNGGAAGGNANRAGTIPDIRSTTIGNSLSLTVQASQSAAYAAAGSPGTTSGATASRSLGTSTWYSKMYFGYTTGSSITGRSDLATAGMGQNERLIVSSSPHTALSFANAAGTTLTFTPGSAPGGGLQYLYVLIHNQYNSITSWKSSENQTTYGMTGNGGNGIGATLSITNDQGFATDYKVYRSAETTNATRVSIYAD